MYKIRLILVLVLFSLMFAGKVHAQWIQTNGPNDGSIVSFVLSPTVAGSTNIFAGGDSVYLSTNHGSSWTATRLKSDWVSTLAVSPNGAGGTNLFAGTYDNGVFLSTDNGTSWNAVNKGMTSTNVSSFALSGTYLFAGTYGDGVFLSTNNGINWTATGLTRAWVNALAVSPNGAGDTNFFAGVHAFAEAPVIVFEHANLIDGISDKPQRDMTVVVVDGKINVVSAAKISPPANAKRFDLSGRWLLPGFIDAHIHPYNISLAKSLLAFGGMTTGRSMFTVRYVDVELRERHRSGEFDIPDILASGYPVVPNIGTFPIPYMDSIFVDHPQLNDLRGVAGIGVAGAQRLVRANIDRHVDWIKVFATNRANNLSMDKRGRALSNEQLVAAVAEAHKVGIPVAAHAYGDDGVVAAVRAGVNSIEHGVYLTDATLELMKKKNVFFVPTMSAFQQDGQTKSNASGANALTAREQTMAVSVRDAARRAYKMGLRVIAGTDGGANIGNEITELVGIGMTPMEAIQAATSRCAEALGISKRTGSIRPGLEADLIVLDANPLEDIKAVSNLVMVVNDGRIVANTASSWVFALAVSGSNLFAGTWGGGIFLSTNNGTNWTAVNNGLTNTNVSALLVSGTNLFAGTWSGGVWMQPISDIINEAKSVK